VTSCVRENGNGICEEHFCFCFCCKGYDCDYDCGCDDGGRDYDCEIGSDVHDCEIGCGVARDHSVHSQTTNINKQI
jgi:hypothetical protein